MGTVSSHGVCLALGGPSLPRNVYAPLKTRLITTAQNNGFHQISSFARVFIVISTAVSPFVSSFEVENEQLT